MWFLTGLLCVGWTTPETVTAQEWTQFEMNHKDAQGKYLWITRDNWTKGIPNADLSVEIGDDHSGQALHCVIPKGHNAVCHSLELAEHARTQGNHTRAFSAFRANLNPLVSVLALIISLLAVCPNVQGSSQIRKDAVTKIQDEKAEKETYLELSLDTLSKYIYRAYAYSEGAVHQVDLSAGLDPWSFNCFVNYDPEISRVNEVIANPDFTESIGDMTVSLGYLFTYYDFEYEYFESLTEKTQEVYIGMTFDSLPFTPSAFVYYDFDKGDGTYYEFSAKETFEGKQIELNALGTLSYNYHYFLERSGWSHAEAALVATTEMTEYLDLESSVRYSYPFDIGIEFGEIEFMDYGLAMNMRLKKNLSARVSINHATPFDREYPDETWVQVSLVWTQ